MVMVDCLTKYAHFIGLSHPYTASTAAQAFLDNIYRVHRLPRLIVSDRDPIFISSFWRHLFSYQGVNLKLSSSYHPQTEVANRCFETNLRYMTSEEPTKWLDWLPLVEWLDM